MYPNGISGPPAITIVADKNSSKSWMYYFYILKQVDTTIHMQCREHKNSSGSVFNFYIINMALISISYMEVTSSKVPEAKLKLKT